MPRWLKKVGKFADKIIDKVTDEVKEEVSERMENVDMGATVAVWTEKGAKCAVLSRETVAICDAACTKREQMMEFGSEIQATLLKFGTTDANILETVKQLTAGDKVKSAMELAEGLDEAALQCVAKSIQIIDLMDEGMDSLPEYVQAAIERQAAAGGDDDDNAGAILKDLDRDLDDVKTCIDSIQNLNLSTALQVGLQAFAQLADKAQRSRTLFDSIRAFAVDMQEISDAFQGMNPMAVASKSSDMLRCLRLSEAMRLIAEGAGKLIKKIIELFKATADRISVLWAALAFAKDCMMDCMAHVNEAKQLCLDAKDKSLTLIDKSVSIKNQLETVGHINIQSIQAVRSLSQDGEMQEAIGLANNMDDLIVECSGKVVAMVDRVSEGFKNLPDILTADINVSSAGSGREDDPEPPNVEDDIAELEESRQAMEGADIITAGKAGVRGFSGVSEKVTVCKNTLDLVEEFAGNCNTTIQSFMSVWDLESASKKITEMCQLVNLGELMKQFADQIKRLLVAIIALMRSAVKKFSEGFPDIAENISETFDSMKDSVKDEIVDKVDHLKDQVNDKLQFWK
jgi:hypothetical protein